MLYILDRGLRARPQYAAWIDEVKTPVRVVDDFDIDWTPPDDAALVVAVQHYEMPELSILRRLTERQQVPTLVLADGILEYRNTWAHPELPVGCLFQPVLAHKIACIGRSQARVLESWGNLGKCEVTGLPRLDALGGRVARRRAAGEPFQLLIMTAKRPGFTPQQVARVEQSLRDLKAWLNNRRGTHDFHVHPIWRLTCGLDQKLKVAESVTDLSGGEMAQVLAQVDAVITTPSTAALEAMLWGLPVALLDYHNSPQYVPAAWTISAAEQIDAVLRELAAPPPAKMLFQDMILHDSLECRTPAAPRMLQLVQEMLRIGELCRAAGSPIRLPRRILRDDQDAHHLPEERFDLRELYPDHAVFADLDRAALQAETENLRKAYQQLMERVRHLEHEVSRDRTENRPPGLARSCVASLRRVAAQLRSRLLARASRASPLGRDGSS